MKNKYLLYILAGLLVLSTATACKSSQPASQNNQINKAALDRESDHPDNPALNDLEKAVTRATDARDMSIAIDCPSIFPRDWESADSLAIATDQRKKTSTMRETQESTARYYVMADVFEALYEKTLVLHGSGMEGELAAAKEAAARYLAEKARAAQIAAAAARQTAIIEVAAAPSAASASMVLPRTMQQRPPEPPPPAAVVRQSAPLPPPPPPPPLIQTLEPIAAAPPPPLVQAPVQEVAVPAARPPVLVQRNITSVTVERAPLPSQYTVRPWRISGDSLTSIAGRPWVYNAPGKWRVLYEANKSRMPQPDNPDLIEPGMILDIPGIMGEIRQGMWDENLSYPTLIPD